MIAPRRHYQAWTAAELAALGTDTDAAVARRLGRSVRAVMTARQAAGIPPHRPHSLTWTRAMLALLGKFTDAEVARRLGVAQRTVLLARAARGIPPCSPKNRPRWLDDEAE